MPTGRAYCLVEAAARSRSLSGWWRLNGRATWSGSPAQPRCLVKIPCSATLPGQDPLLGRTAWSRPLPGWGGLIGQPDSRFYLKGTRESHHHGRGVERWLGTPPVLMYSRHVRSYRVPPQFARPNPQFQVSRHKHAPYGRNRTENLEPETPHPNARTPRPHNPTPHRPNRPITPSPHKWRQYR